MALVRESDDKSRLFQAAVFSPDGKFMAASNTLGDDIGLQIWDTTTMRLMKVMDYPEKRLWYMTHAAFAHDNSFIVTTAFNAPISTWATGTDGLLYYCVGAEHYSVVTICPNNCILVADKNQIFAKSMILSQRELVFAGHESRITAIAVASDSNIVVSADNNDSVRMWNLDTQQQSWVWKLNNHEYPMSLAISFDCKLVAAGTQTGKVWRIRVEGSGGRVEWTVSREQSVIDVSFSHDGTKLFAAADDGKTRNINFINDLGEFSMEVPTDLPYHPMKAARIDSLDESIVTTVTRNGRLQKWRTRGAGIDAAYTLLEALNIPVGATMRCKTLLRMLRKDGDNAMMRKIVRYAGLVL